MSGDQYNKSINKPSPIHYIVLFIVFLLPPIKTKYLLLERAAGCGCFFARYARRTVLRAGGTRPAPTEAKRRPAVLARAGIRRAAVIKWQCREMSEASR